MKVIIMFFSIYGAGVSVIVVLTAMEYKITFFDAMLYSISAMLITASVLSKLFFNKWWLFKRGE